MVGEGLGDIGVSAINVVVFLKLSQSLYNSQTS